MLPRKIVRAYGLPSDAVAGVGQEDTAITVLRSAEHGADHYAAFGLLRGCVIAHRAG